MDVGFGQADARVFDPQRAPVGAQADRGRGRGVERVARGDGVHRVLEQLADVNARRGVQVVREQIDQTPQVDLERVRPVFHVVG